MAASMTSGDPAVDRRTGGEEAVRALLFEDGRRSRALAPDALDTLAALPDSQLLWVDVTGDGLPAGLAETLGIDGAALVDQARAGNDIRREDGWTFLHMRALDDATVEKLGDVPLTVAIGRNVVLTLHPGPVDFLATILDDEAGSLRVGALDAMSFAVALMDRLLTAFLDVRDEFETALDRLELLVLHRPSPRLLREMQRLRRSASRLRRVLATQRDLFDALGRPDFDPSLPPEVARHCRNLSVRYSKVMVAVEAIRELVNGGFDLYTSRTTENTSQEMHTLTVVIVVTCITATLSGLMGAGVSIDFLGDGERFFVWSALGISLLVVATVAWALHRLFRGR